MQLSVKQLNKYKKKNISDLLGIATEHFNKFIRNRDSEDGYFHCISCGECKDVERMHAGHYLAAGLYSMTRFNEKNVHGQCSRCNTHGVGNLIRYREALIKKIGEEEVLYLEQISRISSKWDSTTLISIIETYKQKNKQK